MSEVKSLQIDIVSDVVCPWCYIGKRQLETALATLPGVQATIHWLPYQLDPTIPPGGIDRDTYLTRKFGDRGPGLFARVANAGKDAGLDLAFDKIQRSPNTLDAHRVIRWAWAAGVQDKVVDALFHAYFIDGADIGDADTLVRLAEDAGMDGEVVRRLLADGSDKDAVEGDVEQARSLGVTGVPFFILDQKIGMSGAQPPEVLARGIAKALESADQSRVNHA